MRLSCRSLVLMFVENRLFNYNADGLAVNNVLYYLTSIISAFDLTDKLGGCFNQLYLTFDYS